MIYFDIRQKDGEVIASNIQECSHLHLFKENRNKTIPDKNLKSATDKYDSVSVWLIVENEIDLLRSNKLFKKTMKIYAILSRDFFEYYFSKIRVHSHTLRSIQGKMKQKIDGLASKKDFHGKDYAESKDNIVKKINLNIDKTADTICYLNKRVTEIDAHIEGFDVLYLGDEQDVNLVEVNIKKVLLSIYAPFLSDFSKNGVEVNFMIKDDYADINRVKLDYKMFNLALCNFFDNAIKYSKPYTPIKITFIKNDNSFVLETTMMSLRIDENERDLIFDEGYSGRHATHDAGDGIGMSVMRKALNLTKMGIEIVSDYSESDTVGDRKYVRNIFRIFSLNQSRSRPVERVV